MLTLQNINHTTIIMAEVKLNRLKIVLAERDITNKWLAEQLNVSEITVSRWVSNKCQPPLEQLYSIAQVLDVSPRELIFDQA